MGSFPYERNYTSEFVESSNINDREICTTPQMNQFLSFLTGSSEATELSKQIVSSIEICKQYPKRRSDNICCSRRHLSFPLKFEHFSENVTDVMTDTSTPVEKKILIKPRDNKILESPDLFDDLPRPHVVNKNSSSSKGLYEMVSEYSWEKVLLKNLQTSLTGVPPPPNKTIVQLNAADLFILYNDNLKKPFTFYAIKYRTASLLKPTHTPKQFRNIDWKDISMDMKCHGVHYNRSTDSENIEKFCMKYADRCVGVETSSSFTYDSPSSIHKYRASLHKSPGKRLSHLVGRKKRSSSASSKQYASISSKLGSKQMMINVQKGLKRKRKSLTPKRFVIEKGTPGCKTSRSEGKGMALSSKCAIPSLESSKRALFQSPPHQTHQKTTDVKRMLFPIMEEKNYNSRRTVSAKRRLECMLGREIETPRSLLARSQTFSADSFINDDVELNELTMLRARSDVSIREGPTLSHSHRQKLLWAVSTSLRKRDITQSHPHFTAYAAVLAKVVRRLFNERRDKSASTSITMMRIADRNSFWVVEGKTADEIFLIEKMRKENPKAAFRTKLSGYIAPEDYDKLNIQSPKSISNIQSPKSISNIQSPKSISNPLRLSLRPFNFFMQSPTFTENTAVRHLMTGLTKALTNPLIPDSVNSSSKSNTSGSVLRENVRECELKQKSGQKIEFSGKDQKNVSPHHDNTMQYSGGPYTNMKNVKRQISFDA